MEILPLSMISDRRLKPVQVIKINFEKKAIEKHISVLWEQLCKKPLSVSPQSLQGGQQNHIWDFHSSGRMML